MPQTSLKIATALLCALLAACGGGGGSDPAPAASAPAQPSQPAAPVDPPLTGTPPVTPPVASVPSTQAPSTPSVPVLSPPLAAAPATTQPAQPAPAPEPACHPIPLRPHRADELAIQLLCAPPEEARLCEPVLLVVRLWNFPDAVNVFLIPMPDQRGGDGNLGMPAPRFTLTRTPNSPEQIGRLVFDPKTAPPFNPASGYPSDGGIYASFTASGSPFGMWFDARHWHRCEGTPQ